MSFRKTSSKTVVIGLEGETYKHSLQIKNASKVLKDHALLEQQQFTIETRSDSPLRSKWIVGLSIPESKTKKKQVNVNVQIFCQLVEIGVPGVATLRSRLVIEARYCCGHTNILGQFDTHLSVNESYTKELGKRGSLHGLLDTDDDSINLTLTLSLFQPAVGLLRRQFREESFAAAKANVASLVDDVATDFDVTIVCSSGKKVRCHEKILKASSPVFKKMLDSGLSETQNGTIEVTDVGDKAMTGLVNYMYTGKMPLGWKKPDRIVDFVTVADKYEMTLILKHLDVTLGNIKNLPVPVLRELKELTGMIGLKKAESQLKGQLIDKIMTAKGHVGIGRVFGAK